MKLVYFIKSSPPYNSGETAGFDEKTAARIVKNKQAIYADEVAKDDEEDKEEVKQVKVSSRRRGRPKKSAAK